mmetsp:Transcript_14024/g.29370  ORF Transcript_14024/g.29370 Transcript_14024/m.29370 type:complete len:344 (+) Transcript_14024:145-1176(+)
MTTTLFSMIFARPQKEPQRVDHFTFTFAPERMRFIAYLFFYAFVGLCYILTQTFVVPRLLKGIDKSVVPREKWGCGPFNREHTRSEGVGGNPFDRTADFGFGDGFHYHTQNHLLEKFGFANICTNWDYTPARELSSIFFPFFEFSLIFYLILDLINIKIAYNKGLVSENFYSLTKLLTALNGFLCMQFRQIFVNISYESVRWHTLGFLCLQTAIFLVAFQNANYIRVTKQSYPKLGLTREKTLTLINIYFWVLIPISIVKIACTAYIVVTNSGPSLYKIPVFDTGKVLGFFVDKIWLAANAIAPCFIAYFRMQQEKKLEFKISCPDPDYEPEEGSGETAPLVK